MLLRRYRLELFHPYCPGTRVVIYRTWFGLKLKNKHFATDGELYRYYSKLIINGAQMIKDHTKLNKEDTYVDRIKQYEDSRKQKQVQRKIRYIDMSSDGAKGLPPRPPAPPSPPPMRKLNG